MAIRVQCSNPQCGKSLDCPDEHAGKTVKCSACGTQLQVPASGQPSAKPQGTQMLGDYRLLRKLGEGGMGAVYEAEHLKLERHVALKVLPQKFTNDPTFLERFQREAKSAAALNHTNIIQLYDIGEDRGHHFFGMEFVDGESAQERLQREGKLTLEWALHVVRGVAEALRYAHQRQIIHRDIKPDNIMLTKDGHVKLADLGLAKKMGDVTSGVTQTGAGMGTPYYMAPEQAEDARSVDHRADIYALGITLLHLLAGRRPYDGDSAYGIIIAHVSKPLPTGTQLGTELAPEVEAVIQKMCAKEPDQRYQDYDTLLADLERAQAGQPTAAMTGSEAVLKTMTQPVRRTADSSGLQSGESSSADGSRQEPDGGRAPGPSPAAGKDSGATAEPSRGHRRRGREQKPKSKASLLIGAVAAVLLVATGAFLAMRGGGRADRGSGILPTASSTSGVSDRSSGLQTGEKAAKPPSSSGILSGESSSVGGGRQSPEPGTDSGPTTVRQKPDAGRDSGLPAATPAAQAGATTDAAEMLAYAESYAKEHPAEFAKIIERFREVEQSCKGTVGAMKAKDAAEGWQKQWEVTAEAELGKRRASAAEALKAWKFQEAEAIWDAFPTGLRVASIEPKIKAEQARIEEARNTVAKALEDEAKPLLAKKAEELSAEEVRAVSGLLEKAEKAPEGLPEEAAQAVATLAERLEGLRDDYQAIAASKAQKAFDEFWAKYETLMKHKAFDEALKLCESSLVVHPFRGSPEGEEDPLKRGTTNADLKADAILLKSLFARAEENLPSLVGKTIRVSGMGLKVTAVRAGKLVMAQGRVETVVGPEKLDPEELLKLGSAKETDEKSAAYQEALFRYFYDRPARAQTAFAEAKAKGCDVSFYEERLAELEQGQEKVRAEKEAAALVAQIESAIRGGKVETAESKLEKLEKDFGQTEASKAALAGLRERLTEAQSKAAAKKNLVFIPAGKFTYQNGEEIDLPAFYISKYEVSNAEYDEFKEWLKKEVEKGEKGDPHRFCYPGYLADGKELPEEQLQSLEKLAPEKRLAAIQKSGLKGGEPGGKSHDNGAAGQANHPVVNVDWHDAWAYCRWRGGRLPTEQEWEKAASWDPKLRRKRVYPWGDEFVAKFCNSSAPEDGFAGTCPVDEFPKGVSAYGCSNMAGNVWEWCNSWQGAAGSARVPRGGSWSNGAGYFRCASRFAHAPGRRSVDFGFRFALRSAP